MARYRAKCGIELFSDDIITDKPFMAVLETDIPMHDNGVRTKPPTKCDPKCLKARRPKIITRLINNQLVDAKAWRCKFERVDMICPACSGLGLMCVECDGIGTVDKAREGIANGKTQEATG